MADLEKVIKVYECCKNPWNRRCEECPIEKDCCHDGLPTFAIKNALELLKDYRQHLQNDLETLKEEKRRLEFEYEAKAIREKTDEVIAKLKEKHPCEECQEWECDGCPYSDK